MAGKLPSHEEISAVISAYLAKTPGVACEHDKEADTYLLKDPNGKEAIIGPGWKCSDEGLFGELAEILMEQREVVECPKMPVNSAGRANTLPAQRKSNGGPLVKPGEVVTARDVIDYINPKATEQEAFLFAEFCRRKGADPMTKQVYLAIFVNDKGERNVSFIAGKEYFTEKAEAHPQFDGLKAGIIVRPKAGGDLEHREGTFYLTTEETLLGGWAEVYRKDRKIPAKSEVSMYEYNTGKRNWSKMPATMIRKVAMVQALREAFPQNLGGMYDRAEMEQAGMDLNPENEVTA